MKATLYSLFIVFVLSAYSCQSNTANLNALDHVAATPVTLTSPDSAPIQEHLSFNANAAFLLKSAIKANTNGYIEASSIHLGAPISRGQTLFTLKTKEAESLGNTINQLDPSFNFSGVNRVKSPTNGYITLLNHQNGDYVQDGEVLAEIATLNSFCFIMNLPYEYKQLVTLNQSVNLLLPDNTSIKGFFSQIMPSIDSASQTLKVIIKVPAKNFIPENLIAQVSLVKSIAKHPSLPKESILSDASQQNFWVMKLINDSTAVKIPILKGIESDTNVEILSPLFSPLDKILLTGNYGLADTAKVMVMNKQPPKQ